MTQHEKNPIPRQDREAVENPTRIFRTTMAFNDELMLCHFRMKEGARIPLHSHQPAQSGYVVKGRIRFFTQESSFVAEEGCGYVFDPNENHGAEVLCDSEVIECFSPKRPEFEPSRRK
jgi:quercetin dioxygenase-like cupin family protein